MPALAVAWGGIEDAGYLSRNIAADINLKKRFSSSLISAQTAQEVTQMMVSVVNEGLDGKASVPGYTIAGKTGTAQTAALRTGPEKDIPKKFRDHAWFVAFAPVENPKIAVAVLAEHMGHGGSAAAPLAKELIETYIKVTAAKPLASPGPATPAQVAKAGTP